MKARNHDQLNEAAATKVEENIIGFSDTTTSSGRSGRRMFRALSTFEFADAANKGDKQPMPAPASTPMSFLYLMELKLTMSIASAGLPVGELECALHVNAVKVIRSLKRYWAPLSCAQSFQ